MTEVIRRLEHLFCNDGLRVGFVQPGEEKEILQHLLICEGGYRKAGEGLFTRACSDRIWGNGFKLKEPSLRLDIGKKFFSVRVLRHWNRFPSEAVDVLPLEVFKARLDDALRILI
ncbi:hypothetical protein BTVI_69528 [Pitangus sulphuratus]|nr:hypothetical protein BTVI_69528 [Pitangus sulphuratus]